MAEKKITLEKCGIVDPLNIESSRKEGGYEGLKTALSRSPEEVRAVVKDAGLRGRGGAGFPVFSKWDVCTGSDEQERYLVCNGVEGDPRSQGGRTLLTGDPHRVLEGMVIAAYAIGAGSGYLYCPSGSEAQEILGVALKQAREQGMLGKAIYGSSFDFDIELFGGAGDFIVGEETVLISSMECGRLIARPKPPYPAQAGFRGKPTVVHHPETLANLPAILKRGAEWFRSLGVEHDPGTRVLTLTGGVEPAGVIEVECGTTLREILFQEGRGIVQGKQFKAIQLGGPTGGFIPESLLDTPLDSDSLKDAGQIMGSGSILVITDDVLLVETVRDAIALSVDASCGLCVPCRFGLKVIQNLLDKLVGGEAVDEDLTLLEEMSQHSRDTSLCGLGKTAPLPVLTSLNHFRSDYSAYIKARPAAVGA
jgi:NADH:ubiquinone oxidoreductase subunit F (NADH-binding)